MRVLRIVYDALTFLTLFKVSQDNVTLGYMSQIYYQTSYISRVVANAV